MSKDKQRREAKKPKKKAAPAAPAVVRTPGQAPAAKPR
jgi:hypothetical protein